MLPDHDYLSFDYFLILKIFLKDKFSKVFGTVLGCIFRFHGPVICSVSFSKFESKINPDFE